MRICVDTTVLLDILKDEYPEFQDRVYTAIKNREQLVSPVIVYAELLPQFKGVSDLLDSFLDEHKITIEPLDMESAREASFRWMKYLKRKSRIKCPECGHLLSSKEHLLSDFYIGGYAVTKCDAIITRDRGVYRKYFPELRNYTGKSD
ncbi:MAG: type II toxin-antitoxin system VapC family toxin [Nitrospirae bacterium]|nr:MAG: type II toxin-antitoxin system VapC family toxin [Nitrospirota bacterium]